jgi:hypothetical protein
VKPEIKAKWLKALRGGQYKQGKDVLYNGAQFCCLGVLCDLYAKDQKIKSPWVLDEASETYSMAVDRARNHEVLPTRVRKWAGISNRNPTVPVPGGRERLVDLNDNGQSFLKIAALIEESL